MENIHDIDKTILNAQRIARHMRIGIITDETDSQLAGLGTYTYNIVKHILKTDRKNEYFLIHRKKGELDIYREAKEIILPSAAFPLSAIRNFITMPMKLRRYDLDVVHHTSSIGPFAFKKLIKGKAVETVHDIIPLAHPESFEWQVRFAFKHLLPRIVRNADKILAVSEHTKNDIIKRLGVKAEKIEVAYDAVGPMFKAMDKAKCKESLRKYGITGPFILFVSTLEAKKNVPAALEAFALLKKKGYPHKFVLVGKKGYGYEKIVSAISKLQLQKETIMPGYVPLEDLPKFYNAADAFILPSLYEGFGIPALEAMRCGCPVVCSNAGALPEVTGGAARLVQVNDVQGYAAAMKEIIDSKKTAASMKKKGLVNAKKYSWEKSAEKIIEVYETLA
ncbi:glycosyltransferase family 4 protein [Candidatus Woesearchaeota archaeon]|nr:glycosyltransferase family 4 protein [Candidatus Woesearchaeota archaeon]